LKVSRSSNGAASIGFCRALNEDTAPNTLL
jgi:hypothetical protein